MSVVDSLKKLFGKKRPEGEDTTASADLSLGMPDASMDPNATGSIEAGSTQGIEARGMDPDSVDDSLAGEEIDEAELVSVPLLGRRSIVTHQRILFTLLAFALVVLGAVAIYAVNQADKVAQQVANTGSALMQSQRLAKSVSQALIGSPQAFPDVKESADVLARTVRGLQNGDQSLRLDSVPPEMQEDIGKIAPADGKRREERRHRDGPAEDPHAGGQRPAHHQSPVRPTCSRLPRRWQRSSCSRTRLPTRSPPPGSW
jgi:twitching motility protein PilJ